MFCWTKFKPILRWLKCKKALYRSGFKASDQVQGQGAGRSITRSIHGYVSIYRRPATQPLGLRCFETTSRQIPYMPAIPFGRYLQNSLGAVDISYHESRWKRAADDLAGSNAKTVKIIDQRRLPHELVRVELQTVDEVITAIKDMYVRGAPLIGATGAYGVYLAALNAPHNQVEDSYLIGECDRIKSARPTAVNLAWAVDAVLTNVLKVAQSDKRITIARESGRIYHRTGGRKL